MHENGSNPGLEFRAHPEHEAPSDAGIPLETVLAARRRTESYVPLSRNAGRFWELSGGILHCSECGRRMQTQSIATGSKTGRLNYYYKCQSTTNGKADRCKMRKHVRADKIEAEVWKAVRCLVDDKHYVLNKLEEHFEQRRRELIRPGMNAGDLVKRLDQIDKRWTKVKLAYEADAVSIADLKARRAELDGERDAIERELQRTTSRTAELEKLDAEEAETRARIEAGYGGLDEATLEKRSEIYGDLGLRVEVGADAVPHIFGMFPVGRYEDIEDRLLVRNGKGVYILSCQISSNGASSGSGRTS